MVHALKKIHGLLEPSAGCLIDLHPRPAPALIEVQVDDGVHSLGLWSDETRFDAYRLADQALVQVVDSGWYVLEDEQQFIFTVQADVVADLDEYLVRGNDTWYQKMNAQFAGWIEKILRLPGEKKEIRLKRLIGIHRLRSLVSAK